MKRILLMAALALLLAAPAVIAAVDDDELLTVAEKSGFTATSRNADVIAFARELAARSSEVRLEWLGSSVSGNPIPLLILGRPVPSKPSDMIGDDRLCVFIQANIHAGEVEGKEATQMLARDILLGELNGLLDHLVILIAPDLNTEGNDQISPEHRRYQGGPEQGVGLRYTFENFDINRDWIKLETPEARSVVRLLNRWNPVLLVDCHTTDGSFHRHPLTYAPAYNPSADPDVLAYNSEVLLPAADARLKQLSGYDAIPYGNFIDGLDPNKGWETFDYQPRYTTNYAGLRNRLAVLIETYAYADYRTRVLSNYGFLEALLHQCDADRAKIAELVRNADARAYGRATALDPARDRIVKEAKAELLPEPLEIHSYEFETWTDDRGRRRLRPTEVEKTYTVPHYGRFAGVSWIPMASAYFLPQGMEDSVAKLREHGIVVERLTRELKILVSKFTIKGLESAPTIYQGHRFTTLAGEWREEEVAIPAGTWVVRTAQPLGLLAAYMLEPESGDGLVTWNFLDRYLTQQWGGGFGEFPILKLTKPANLPVELPEP
jgi:hypothetical protein